MIDAELAPAVQSASDALSRYDLARALGGYITDGLEEASQAEAAIIKMELNEFHPEEGIDIWVTDLSHDAELAAELLDPETLTWNKSEAGSPTYKGSITRISGYRQLFVGRSVEYDEETRIIWVYNARRDFRVLYGPGIVMKAVTSETKE